MKLLPVPGYILVRPIVREDYTTSGLVMPEVSKDKPAKGVALEVGGGIKDQECPVKKGQKVIYKRYGGQSVREGDEDLLLLKFDEIMGVYANG